MRVRFSLLALIIKLNNMNTNEMNGISDVDEIFNIIEGIIYGETEGFILK